MITTWICLLLISYSVIEVNCVHNKLRGVRKSLSNASHCGKRLIIFMKKCPSYLKRFVKWILQHIKYGIRCAPYNDTTIKCRTKGGMSKNIPTKKFIKLPIFVKKFLLRKLIKS